jgi:NAD(P)-dependent dehydrogenase (short-subunit alcohol dehydrogenase family)
MFNEHMLAQKRILITGGGTGLGKAIGRRAVELGAELIICGRRLEVLQQAAAELSAPGRKPVKIFQCDIREADAVARMMDEIWSEGPLDVLINNAAGTMLARTETLSSRAFDAVLRVSLNGAVYNTLEVGRRWIDTGHPGVVLFITASGVERGRPFMVPLTVAKGALLTLLRSLAVEWGPKGIRLLGVAPGSFPTPGAAAKLQAGRSKDPVLANPLTRSGRHEELADLCSFLVSDRAAYITGEMITIDGGKGLRGQDMDDLFSWSQDQWDAIRPAKR